MLNRQQAQQLRNLIADMGLAMLDAAALRHGPAFDAALTKAQGLHRQLETYLQHLTEKD